MRKRQCRIRHDRIAGCDHGGGNAIREASTAKGDRKLRHDSHGLQLLDGNRREPEQLVRRHHGQGATLYDDDGAILGTGEDYAQLLLPQHKVAFTQQTSEFEASRIEVEVAELDDDDFAAWDLEKEGDPQFEVTDLNEVDSDYSTNVSGNVTNDFTKKTEIRVVVCMRDASGALVDGAQAYVTDVPASDSTSFTAYMPRKAAEHATVEGYSNPSVPMS